ncbi:hypothetical protein ACA910_020878 [Epithemia clementina (nom. ined.)]
MTTETGVKGDDQVQEEDSPKKTETTVVSNRDKSSQDGFRCEPMASERRQATPSKNSSDEADNVKVVVKDYNDNDNDNAPSDEIILELGSFLDDAFETDNQDASTMLLDLPSS